MYGLVQRKGYLVNNYPCFSEIGVLLDTQISVFLGGKGCFSASKSVENGSFLKMENAGDVPHRVLSAGTGYQTHLLRSSQMKLIFTKTG